MLGILRFVSMLLKKKTVPGVLGFLSMLFNVIIFLYEWWLQDYLGFVSILFSFFSMNRVIEIFGICMYAF